MLKAKKCPLLTHLQIFVFCWMLTQTTFCVKNKIGYVQYIGDNMKLRILDILNEKQKTKYWLYNQMGLSYQNFNRIVNNQTTSIKFKNIKNLCDILECTPNDLFDEYYKK